MQDSWDRRMSKAAIFLWSRGKIRREISFYASNANYSYGQGHNSEYRMQGEYIIV